jgi:di/tricarboxylate transporter
MLGALIPVSDALHSTGGTDLIAGWLSHVASVLHPMGALALLLVAAMAVTPFLNNAATVLVTDCRELCGQARLYPDPFLMAVAIGAAWTSSRRSGINATRW